ncbi:MAG: cytochrome c oxidase subunit II [Chloroflexota bacterium]|nr:cytochrome c oxidase subunit II [Chloroflexota bacterium]
MPKSATDIRHFIIAGVLVAITTVLLDLLLKAILPMPVQGSHQAQVIDQLTSWHLTLIAFLFSLVVVIMLYSLFVFRKKDGDESEGAHFEGNTVLEIAWTVIPLIVVFVFGFFGVRALSDVTRAAPDEITVNVTGFQWSWLFEYPDSGVASNELVLPVDRAARMDMTSRDVIHSFWIPEMRVKQDLVPGMTTTLRFTPSVTGEYTVDCAELCGLSHYSMVAPVRIVEQAEYEQWLAERTAGTAPALAQTGDETDADTDVETDADAQSN